MTDWSVNAVNIRAGMLPGAILMHWPDDRLKKLEDLLEAKSLNYIAVIPYDRVEIEEDEED